MSSVNSACNCPEVCKKFKEEDGFFIIECSKFEEYPGCGKKWVIVVQLMKGLINSEGETNEKK